MPKGQWSDSLNQAVASLIDNYGIPVVAAAGNAKVDSCTIVPANVAQVSKCGGKNSQDLLGRREQDLQGSLLRLRRPSLLDWHDKAEHRETIDCSGGARWQE